LQSPSHREVSPEGAGAANMFKAAGGLKGAKKGVSFAGGLTGAYDSPPANDNGGEPGPSTAAASRTAALLMGKAPPGGEMSRAGGAAAALLMGPKTGTAAALSVAGKLRTKIDSRKPQAKKLVSKFAKASNKQLSKWTSSKRPTYNMVEDASLKNLNYGITVQYLVEFTNHHDCWDLTTRQVRRRPGERRE